MRPASRRQPRTSSARRGDAAQVLLITLAVVGGIIVLACAGAGVLGYLWFQKNLSRAMITEPTAIRELTAELAQIDIPPVFAPMMGSSLFQMRTAVYQWCPQGNCAFENMDDDEADAEETTNHLHAGSLTLVSLGQQAPAGFDDAFNKEWDEEMLPELQHFTKEIYTRTINGQECRFVTLRGELPDAESERDDAETSAPVDALQPANTTGEQRFVVYVSGAFPGPRGPVQLHLHLNAADYDADLVRQMIDSIR